MRFFQTFKKEILSFFLCFVFFLLVSFVTYQIVQHKYQKSFLENNAFLINHIIQIHPELEQEVMSAFQNGTKNYDLSLLNKYGISETADLSQIDFVKELEDETKQIIFCAFLISFFFFFLSVLFITFEKNKRIHELHDYLFHVLRNEYEVNLKDYREDDLSAFKSDLLKVTNKLRNISEISQKDKKNLERTLSDISHQLRTPLTSLNIINDVLKTKKISKSEQLRFLSQQKEQLERMEWLIVTLLKMSQIDSGTIIFQKQEVLIHEVIKEALKPSLIPLELKQIECEITVDQNLKGNLDFHWTVEALINLIKNAMEHTDINGTLKIQANDNPLYIEIIIEDNGSGISKEDIPHIFERFYKGKSKTDSIGIGLNLSKSIIEKQSGTIHVESELSKGTKFIIHFYKVTI